MHFSEDDLRTALRRQDPGPDFTQRVMARVGRAEAKTQAQGKLRGFFKGIFPLRMRPALGGALAALLLLAGGGLGYRQHQQNERRRQHELAKAKEAERQAVLALRITNAKMNRVFQRVRESQENEVKVRREKL